jgi:hypothetical protein
VNAAGCLGEFLQVSWAAFLKPLRAPCCQGINRVRPRITNSRHTTVTSAMSFLTTEMSFHRGLGENERIMETHPREVKAALREFEAFAATRIGKMARKVTGFIHS